MSLSYVQYSGDGETTDFSLTFPYISRSHVAVAVDGLPVSFSWVGQSIVRVASAPIEGSVIEIRRSTPSTNLLVDFVDGATLTETDLDLSARQNLYVAQEATDKGNSALNSGSDGTFDFGNRRIKNVADPVNAQDGVNKQWVETAMTSQLFQATEARNAAVSASNTATTKAGEAVAFRDAAQDAASDAALSAAEAANYMGTIRRTLRYGAGAPLDSLGDDGDFYIDTVANKIHGPRSGGTWPAGTSIVGPQGQQGPQGNQGPQGVKGDTGSQGPAGSAGADGKTIRYGSSNPTGATGVDGDWYINVTANTLHGPKSGGAWPAGVSLVGPQGPQGIQGNTGPQGVKGDTGSQGPQGPQGPAGPATTDASQLSTGTVAVARLPSRFRDYGEAVTDFSSAVGFGYYSAGPGATNSPFPANYVGMVVYGDQDYLTQEAWIAGAGSLATMYRAKRTKRGGTWDKWGRSDDNKPLSVKLFGATGNGTTDDSLAFVTAIVSGQPVYVPPGDYLLGPAAQLWFSGQSIHLIGAGTGLTRLIFGSGNPWNEGLTWSQTDIVQTFTMSGIAWKWQKPWDVNSKIIHLVSAATAGTAREWRRATIEDCHFEASSGGEFGHAIYLNDCGWSSIRNCVFRGQNLGHPNYRGLGISIAGSNTPCEFNFTSLWMYSLNVGVGAPSYCEGLTMTQFHFVNVTFGVYIAQGCLGMMLSDGHINCGHTGVWAATCTQAVIRGLLIYVDKGSGHNWAGGVRLASSNYADIDVTVIAVGSGVPATQFGVLCTGNVAYSTIKGRFSGLPNGPAVWLQSGSYGNTLMGIIAVTMGWSVLIDSGATDTKTIGFFGSGYTNNGGASNTVV